MVQESQLEEYDKEGIDAYVNSGRPIPGQSLTSSPEQRRPFEQPPEFTNYKEALDFTVGELLREEVYTNLVIGIGQGVPITDVALQIGYVGFREGKWNPDLMLMLIEPLIYVLMSLCEKAGVEYRLSGDEEIQEIQDSAADETDILDEQVKNLAENVKAKIAESGDIPAGAIPTDIVQQIQSTPVPQSLLARPEEEEEAIREEDIEEPETRSLLERG